MKLWTPPPLRQRLLRPGAGTRNSQRGWIMAPYRYAASGYLSPFYPSWLVSMRLRNAAYAGACCRVKNIDTAVETDIPFDSNGWCSTSALAATYSAVQTVGMTKWYAQDASGLDAVQTTDAYMPRMVINGTPVTQNGHPVARWSFGSTRLQVPANAQFGLGTGGGAIEVFALATTLDTGHYNTLLDFRGSGGSGVSSCFVTNTRKLAYYDGTLRGNTGNSVADASLYHFEWDISTSNVYQFLNGNLESTAATTANLGATASLLLGNNTLFSTDEWPGVIGEIAVVKGSTLHTASFTARSYA